ASDRLSRRRASQVRDITVERDVVINVAGGAVRPAQRTLAPGAKVMAVKSAFEELAASK